MKYIIIIHLLFLSCIASGQVSLPIDEFPFYIGTKGVSYIKERENKKSKKVILLNQNDYIISSKIFFNNFKTIKTYKYRSTDSTLQVFETIDFASKQEMFRYKIFFNNDSLLIGFEIYEGDDLIVYGKDFKYKNQLLVEYKRGSPDYALDIINLQYDDNNSLVKKLIAVNLNNKMHKTMEIYTYNKQGYLTDLIIKNDISDSIQQNIISHTKYNDFDSLGNWHKCYYISNGITTLKSKRKLK